MIINNGEIFATELLNPRAETMNPIIDDIEGETQYRRRFRPVGAAVCLTVVLVVLLLFLISGRIVAARFLNS